MKILIIVMIFFVPLAHAQLIKIPNLKNPEKYIILSSVSVVGRLFEISVLENYENSISTSTNEGIIEVRSKRIDFYIDPFDKKFMARRIMNYDNSMGKGKIYNFVNHETAGSAKWYSFTANSVVDVISNVGKANYLMNYMNEFKKIATYKIPTKEGRYVSISRYFMSETPLNTPERKIISSIAAFNLEESQSINESERLLIIIQEVDCTSGEIIHGGTFWYKKNKSEYAMNSIGPVKFFVSNDWEVDTKKIIAQESVNGKKVEFDCK